MRMKIIKAYLGKKLIIIDRDDENIQAQLEKLELDKKIFSELKLSKLSQTQVDALKKKLEEQEKELDIFRKKTPEILWTERLIKLKNIFIEERIYPISLEDAIQIDDSSNMIIDGEVSYKKALVNCIWD
jgi:glutamine synthetase type III